MTCVLLSVSRLEADKELSTKEREYEQMKGHKYMKRDEFKNYAASLRDKSAKFKRLKACPVMPLAETRLAQNTLNDYLLNVLKQTLKHKLYSGNVSYFEPA